MKTCPSCGNQNRENVAFCVSCGASFKNVSTNSQLENNRTQSKKNSTKGKSSLVLTLTIVLGILLFTSYQLLSKKYSVEAVEEQFKSALITKDKTILKEIIKPDDARIKIDNHSLHALFALIESEPSIVEEMTADLSGGDTFFIQQDGKHFGIFDRYVIRAAGYFIHLSNTASIETTVYLNDSEIGTLGEEEEYKEFGPYLTGSYLVKAVNNANDQQGEDMTTVRLAGFESKLEVSLDTEVVDTDAEAVDQEEKIVKEIVKEVVTIDNSYILPGSDYMYFNSGDLYHLSPSELRLARNEIYARHGYIFQAKELQNYFDHKEWYSPNSYYDGYLSDVEKYNVDLIKSLE